MLTAQQRAQFDEAVAHSDISKSLEEASGWLHGDSPPRPGKPKPTKAHKKKPGACAPRSRARAC